MTVCVRLEAAVAWLSEGSEVETDCGEDEGLPERHIGGNVVALNAEINRQKTGAVDDDPFGDIK